MRFRKRTLLIPTACFVLASVMFAGCLKSVENTPPKPQTYISILHLAPAAPSVDVYLNDKKASSTSIPSGTYFNVYSALEPGFYSIDFKKSASDSVVASIPADIYDSLQYSTLLLYNDVSGTGVDAVRIEDDFSQFSTSKTNLRFFHVSPGLMAVDVYLDDDIMAGSRQYADNVINPYNNQFGHFESGYYTVSVKKAGTDSLIVQTPVTFQQSQAYTILLNGVAGQTGDNALAIDVLQASN